MSSLLIRGGRLIDPSRGLDRVSDVLIRDGRIAEIGVTLAEADETLDACGWIVCPGFIDTHVAVRDPGFEEDETTATATAAALAGGFTTIAALPDTRPVVDNAAAAEYVVLQAERAGNCRIHPLGAVTRGHDGAELADLGQLARAGALAFTDAKSPIRSAEIMRRALEYARMFDRPIFSHAQDPTLIAGGVMHEGYFSTLLGLQGMPAAAESIFVSRDIALAELTGGRVHLMSISTAGAVEQVRRAKQRGIAITCDVTPHHLTLTDEAMQTYESNCKVMPPLRSGEHIEALIAGLVDGTIDAISADHQPCAAEKKDRELDQVPFGIVGLETLLPLCVKSLIETRRLDWPQLISKLTTGPAAILNLPNAGTLAIGAPGDVTLFDPDACWVVDPRRFRSKSRNSPFGGWSVTSQIRFVLVDGNVRFRQPLFS
ncbi:MAG: dihydroorotase [Planctomycetales bacterium]|jgi:dihydroorotase|nr:dihydroorotase [Planctomycetales bacterium]